MQLAARTIGLWGMADTLSKELGARIRELRLQAGLTQEQFGNLVGKTPVAVSNVERGRATPSVASLRVFADRLGVPLHDMFRFGTKPRGGAKAGLNAKIELLKKADLDFVTLVVDALLKKRARK